MSQSLSSILVHLVFSTKNREPLITPTIEEELHPYVAAIFSLSRTITVADLVEEVKTSTSKWIKTKGREFRNFHWQRGYGSLSIAQPNVEELRRYIENQKTHHRRVTFQDEYRRFLRAYEIGYDERYVWDLRNIFRAFSADPLWNLDLGRWPRLFHRAPLAL